MSYLLLVYLLLNKEQDWASSECANFIIFARGGTWKLTISNKTEFTAAKSSQWKRFYVIRGEKEFRCNATVSKPLVWIKHLIFFFLDEEAAWRYYSMTTLILILQLRLSKPLWSQNGNVFSIRNIFPTCHFQTATYFASCNILLLVSNCKNFRTPKNLSKICSNQDRNRL